MADRGEIIWQPRPGAWEASRIGSFAAVAGETVGSHFGDYESLLSWSLDDPPDYFIPAWAGVIGPKVSRGVVRMGGVMQHPPSHGGRCRA